MTTEKMSLKLKNLSLGELKLPEREITKFKKEELEKVVQFIKRHGQKLPIIVDDEKVILQGYVLFIKMEQDLI